MKHCIILILLLFITFHLNAKGYKPVHFRQSNNLQKIIDDALVSKMINYGGLSAAVSFPDNTIWRGTSGYSCKNKKLEPDMLFGIASCTKNFIAALMLQLEEENKVSIDDKIERWLPEYQHINPTITIKQLLNHTSGVYNYDCCGTVWLHEPKYYWQPEELIEKFVSAPYFDPGQDFSYSNTNYVLAGMIIKTVTGQDVSTALRNRFFEPLGLQQTFLYPEENYSGARVHVWGKDPFGNDTAFIDLTDLYDTSLFSSAWTSAALLATAEDLVKWSKLLYSGELLCEASRKKMLTSSPYNDHMGLGTMINEFGVEDFIGHSGIMREYSSIFGYFPKDSVSVALLCNQEIDFNSILDIWIALHYEAITITDQKKKLSNVQQTDIAAFGTPNPFTNVIEITVNLPSSARFAVHIYNSYGQKINTLQKKTISSQKNSIIWNGHNGAGHKVSHGIYWCNIVYGSHTQSLKLLKK